MHAIHLVHAAIYYMLLIWYQRSYEVRASLSFSFAA